MPPGGARATEDPFGLARLARPCLRVYGDQDGLPASTVEAVRFDHRGYLWVGTEDGAACYNGRTWRRVDMPDRSRSNWIKAIQVGADGCLWFGINGGGVAQLDGRTCTTLDSTSGLPDDLVRCLLETEGDGGGRALWVGTYGGGLARYERGRWTIFDDSSGLPHNGVRCLLETTTPAGQRSLWVGTNGGGIARLDGDRCTVVDTSSGLPSNAVLSLLETEGAGGRTLWVGTNGGGLARLERGRWTVFDESNGLPNNLVTSLLEREEPDGERALWVGTWGGGSARLGRGGWSVVDSTRGLPNDAVISMTEGPGDRGGRSLWIGINAGGLVRLRPGGWSSLDTSSGLPSNLVTGLVESESPEGEPSLLVGMYARRGLAALARGRWTRFDAAEDSDGMPDELVFSLTESRGDGGRRELWVGTIGGGLARLAAPGPAQSEAWTVVDTASGLPHNEVSCLLATETEAGCRVLWIGTQGGGLARLERDRLTVYDTESGLPGDRVTCLLETAASDDPTRRALWVGTQGDGLARLEGGRWTIYDASNGLPSSLIVCLQEVVAEDGERTLWVGTHGGVAYRRLDAPVGPWRVLTDATAPPLPNNTVIQIRQDHRARVYLSTNKGVARLTPRTATPDDPSPFSVYTFTTEDGLPHNEGAPGASLVDGLGRVWFGTVGGAAAFDPAAEVEDRRPKPLYIERVLLDGTERSPADLESLRHDENNLEFEYTLLSFFRERDTRYRSQLVGFDERATDWTEDWKRNYTNLPPGAYTFRVWGRDYAGNVTGPVEANVRIKPPPWRTWPAYALYAGVVAGVGYAGMRLRLGALERRGRELERLVHERTAELAESERRALAAKDEALEAKQEAVAAREAALEASQAKSVFLANMSHELRTPLNAVIGFSQVLERRGTLGDDDRESLRIIQRSGEHLLGLINDVLSISKIEAGRLTLDERPFDLPDLLKAVEAIVRVRAEEKGIEVAFDVDPALPRVVLGDEGKLRQVLINLLGNAVKFTEHGRVTLRARRGASGRGAAFDVEDTGHGIAADELGKLFETFSQTESGRSSREGTGLGLVISREIVRLMGGDISVRSRLGEGTTFSFEVGLRVAEGGAAARESRRVVGLAPGQEPPRLLVADDLEENRRLLSELLASVGFEVREAANGTETVELWRSWRPHLIWMDMRMPVMDGREATRRIRALEAERGEARPTVIVALTASAFEHERGEILACGADDFVTKPFRVEALLARASELLGVTYLYEEQSEGGARADGGRGSAPLTAEALVGLAREHSDALKLALEDGDFKRAAQVAERIRAEHPRLGGALLAEIRAFNLDALLDALESLPPADLANE